MELGRFDDGNGSKVKRWVWVELKIIEWQIMNYEFTPENQIITPILIIVNPP
tara:strand:- start:370 stop:525 length:156 start_codon:yes stop_codon:yes gene_type:complete